MPGGARKQYTNDDDCYEHEGWINEWNGWMNEWTCRLCNPSVTSVGDWRCVLCHCHDNREVMQRMLRSSWIYVSHCASDESLYERVCVCAVTCCSHKNACCMRSTCIVTVCSRRSKVQFSKLSYTLHSIQARARPKPRTRTRGEAKSKGKGSSLYALRETPKYARTAIIIVVVVRPGQTRREQRWLD